MNKAMAQWFNKVGVVEYVHGDNVFVSIIRYIQTDDDRCIASRDLYQVYFNDMMGFRASGYSGGDIIGVWRLRSLK